jgi:Transglycosylase SLT domain
VSVFAAVRRARVSVVVAISAALLAAGPLALTPAHADTTSNLSARVQQLLNRVHALQSQAAAAEKTYQQAFSSVANSVSDSISADQASGDVANRASAAQAALVQGVQGLYESGGQLGADAAVLTSGTINQLYDRTILANDEIQAQESNVQAAITAARTATDAAAAASRHANHSIGTERTIAVASSRVSTLLRQESALLKQTSGKLASVRAAQAAAIRAAAAALAAQNADVAAITTASVAGLHILPPDAQYLALYKAAAPTCPGLSWTVLAAIGQVESGHGRNPSLSSAGAMGPMQFEPATFTAYAVDGDHDGLANIEDPADAIYTAAHYLCANGAGVGGQALNGAIFHYNHAEWYVAMVLKLAGMYAVAYP